MKTLSLIVVLLASSAFAQVPTTQPYELASQWAPWTGQVASLCGPGKNCTVNSLRATSTGTGTTAAIRLTNNAGSLAWCDNTNNCNWLQVSNNATNGLLVNNGGGGASVTGSQFVVGTTGFSAGSNGSGTAFASFPTCNSGMPGRFLYDSTNGFWRACDGVSNWNVVDSSGRPPLFTQRRYLLDVGLDGSGAALAWNPAPRPAGAAATVTETCSSMSGSTLGTEPNRFDVKNYGTSAVSGNVCSVLTTLGFKREKSPRWCVRAGPQNLSNVRIFVGLSNALPGASDTAASNHYAAFRFSTNVPDSVWQACSADGSTASCTSTTVAPSPAVLQLLCVDMRESGAVSFSIDGVVVVRKTTNLPTATTALGGFWTNETLTTSTKSFYATSASLEIN